jgi:hypothetical protein
LPSEKKRKEKKKERGKIRRKPHGMVESIKDQNLSSTLFWGVSCLPQQWHQNYKLVSKWLERSHVAFIADGKSFGA